MKKSFQFLLTTFLSCLIITSACTGHNENKHDNNIQLNAGKKWTVDKPMLEYIQNMENDIVAFNGATLAEYQVLSQSLKKNIDLLTSNCTMTGDAHDELHKWLLPYIKLVGELEDSKKAEEAAGKLDAIKTSLQTFHQYFQ